MSKEKPMGIAAKVPHVRCSAAYPTGRERIENSRVEHVERVEGEEMKVKMKSDSRVEHVGF